MPCTPSESLILSKILYHGWTPIDTDSEEAPATQGLLSVSIGVHPWLIDFGCGLAWLGRVRNIRVETTQPSSTEFFGLSASATIPQSRTNAAAPVAIRSGQLIVRVFVAANWTDIGLPTSVWRTCAKE